MKKLIFIYNANSGLRNAIVDSAHKIFSPTTYECSLCSITYGAFSENAVWKKFRKRTDVEMEFLHKDEFAKTYGSTFEGAPTFPIVLEETDNRLGVFIGTDELNSMKNATELIDLIQKRR